MNKNSKQQFIKLSKRLQDAILTNKKKKKFNITDIPLEFSYTYGELGEAFDAWRKRKGDLGEELADVAIYLYGLSSILKINLGREVVNKLEKNKQREYHVVKGVRLKK